MYKYGKTIETKDGRILAILTTIKDRNRVRHGVVECTRGRSGGLSFSERITQMTAKALRKLER